MTPDPDEVLSRWLDDDERGPEAMARLIDRISQAPLVAEEHLDRAPSAVSLGTEISEGERRALQWYSVGWTREMIADQYGVSPATVRTQTRTAMFKLRAKTKTHAVAIAIRQGLIL